MSDKLQFLQNRVWKVVIFIEKETTYNWLPMTWGRQHNFTQLAFVEAEWRERRETWQQLWNEKIEKTEKVSEANKQASSLRKKKTSIEKEIESEDLNEDEKDYVLFLLTILAKKVLSVMIRKRLLSTFIPCV